MADGVPVWDATAAEQVPDSTLNTSTDVDIAIVGGGFTGLSTALHCAQAGLRVQVIEAQTPGAGGSGRNVGLVNAGLWLPPDTVVQRMGAHGERFLQRFADGPDVVFDLIEKHQIRCNAVRNGTLHAAHSVNGLRGLQARFTQWQKRGAPVTLLDRASTQELTGTAAFHGALLDQRAGTINPMGYVRGLARAANSAGADIATGIAVQSLRRAGNLWHLGTPKGQVTARNVVLATNAYADGLWPGLNSSYSTIHFFQIATEPLGTRAAHILPQGQGLWDTGTVMLSCRRDTDGRLILGSMGRAMGGLTRRWATRQLSRLFPELGTVRFEDPWHGRIAMTSDHLPRILALDTGLWAPSAYNGRGITTGTLFGQALARVLSHDDPDALPLPVGMLKRDPLAHVRTQAYDIALFGNQMFKSLL